MAQQHAQPVAFSMPGGESCARARSRPIDLAHLSRQTMGDRTLEQEVLGLFLQQAVSIREALTGASIAERLRLAHGLKGSARGVGAFAIADCAAEIEAAPGERSVLSRLARHIDDLREFMAAIGR